jgi:heme o synthase
LLGAVTLGTYLLVYTPLKRVTPWNTPVGAVSGAMPILMGWTAACGELSRAGWVLYAILYLWQMPHFFAIAWLYRADYERAGFAMLSVNDPSGHRTGRQSLFYAMILVPVSLAPFFLGLAGAGYGAAALGLGSIWLWQAGRFAGRPEERRAQALFLYSLLYLPLLLVWMLLDRVKL